MNLYEWAGLVLVIAFWTLMIVLIVESHDKKYHYVIQAIVKIPGRDGICAVISREENSTDDTKDRVDYISETSAAFLEVGDKIDLTLK